MRVPDENEKKERAQKGTIRVSVSTEPRGARVFHGGKLLGATPFTLTAKRGSGPLDIVIRRKGYMTLRTRIVRKKSRSYFYKLTPAKFQ